MITDSVASELGLLFAVEVEDILASVAMVRFENFNNYCYLVNVWESWPVAEKPRASMQLSEDAISSFKLHSVGQFS